MLLCSLCVAHVFRKVFVMSAARRDMLWLGTKTFTTLIFCWVRLMFGINIEQWRSSIGHFNSHKNALHTPADTCKFFLIFVHLMNYLRFFKDYLLPFLVIIFNIILLFGYSFMFVTLFTCLTTSRMGLCISWFIFSPQWNLCHPIPGLLFPQNPFPSLQKISEAWLHGE